MLNKKIDYRTKQLDSVCRKAQIKNKSQAERIDFDRKRYCYKHLKKRDVDKQAKI